MNEKTLKMIISCLELRKESYEKKSDVYRELQNTINMLSANCYKEKVPHREENNKNRVDIVCQI